MLSEEERCEIEAELAHYPQKQAVCIEALKIVQRHRGWVSDEAIKDLAELLEMTPDELDGVATFYNLIFRQAGGQARDPLCDSVSAGSWAMTVCASTSTSRAWALNWGKRAPTALHAAAHRVPRHLRPCAGADDR